MEYRNPDRGAAGKVKDRLRLSASPLLLGLGEGAGEHKGVGVGAHESRLSL